MQLPQRLNTILEEFKAQPQTVAIGIAGSRSSSHTDMHSDYDIYIYTRNDIPISVRQAIADRFAVGKLEINNQFWGAGDEWYDAELNTKMDIMFFDYLWMAGQVNDLISRHIPKMGYTTCFWHTVKNTTVIYDPQLWLETLIKSADCEYPHELAVNILKHNYPILRFIHSSYYHQIELALERKDPNSVQHRVTELLKSYFDILFAVNYALHPGEKRLLTKVKSLCARYPQDFDVNITDLIGILPGSKETVLPEISRLLEGLDEVIVKCGFDGIIAPFS